MSDCIIDLRRPRGVLRALCAAVLAAVAFVSVSVCASAAPAIPSTAQDNPPWGLDRIDQRTRPLDSKFSSYFTGAGVDVYVMDSGVRASHQEFAGRMKAGWSVEADTTDCNGNGTHVAGTIGGTTFGVAKKVSIVPVKIIPCSGDLTGQDLLDAINWVIDNHLRPADRRCGARARRRRAGDDRRRHHRRHPRERGPQDLELPPQPSAGAGRDHGGRFVDHRQGADRELSQPMRRPFRPWGRHPVGRLLGE
jgi:subtilase family protein